MGQPWPCSRILAPEGPAELQEAGSSQSVSLMNTAPGLSCQGSTRYARQEDKVPYMLIIGEKEITDGTVSVRDRATDQTETMTLEALIAKLEKEIKERK